MPVKVECPKCLESRSVPDTKIGSKLKCSSCGAVFVAEPSSSPTSGRSKKKRKNQSSQAGIWIGAGIGGIAVLGAVAYFLMGSKPEEIADRPSTTGAASAPAMTPTATETAATVQVSTGWITPDPVAESIDWSRQLAAEIPLPSHETKIVVPQLTSPYIATVGLESATIVDLRTGQQVHRLTLPKGARTNESLSLDGKSLAFNPVQLPPPPAPGQKPVIPKENRVFHIWSTETGQKVLETRPIHEAASFQWAQFLTGDQLSFVAINPASPGGSSIDGMVLRTSSDQPVSFFTFPEYVFPNTLMLTPGGRYLIAVNGFVAGHPNQVVAVDLSNGKVVGKAESQEPTESNEIMSTAFSFDGKQLAVLHRIGESELRITIIDTATGKRNPPLKIPGNAVELLKGRLLSLRGVHIEMGWYADHRHLFLFDGLVIDSTTGAIVTDQRLDNLARSGIVGQSLIWKDVTGDSLRTRPFGAAPSSP